jgi:hypothetical protein
MSGGEIMNDEKEYRLSKLEQETIIIFNEEEDDATIETCNRRLIKRLEVLCQKHRNFYETERSEYGKTFIVPKKYINVLAPRSYDDSRGKRLKKSSKK